MFDVIGYAVIKNDQKTGVCALPIQELVNRPLRVIEFNRDGGVMVLSPCGKAIATFDKEDVAAKFECKVWGDVICAPDTNVFEQALYASRAHSRKGGYGPIVKQLVIGSSLHKGVFNDHVLWAKQ